MSFDYSSLTILADWLGNVHHLSGDPKSLELSETVEVGQAWWLIFPDKIDQGKARARFASHGGNGRIRTCGLTTSSGGSFRLEFVRLSEDEKGNFVIVVSESRSAETACSDHSLLFAPYAEERSRMALGAADQVTWILDSESGLLTLQGGSFCMLGFQFSEIAPTASFWWSRVHPDDEHDLRATISSCDKVGVDEWEFEHRFLDSN